MRNWQSTRLCVRNSTRRSPFFGRAGHSLHIDLDNRDVAPLLRSAIDACNTADVSAWRRSCRSAGMNWLVWLGLAVIIAAFAAVTGIKPRGGRHVAHTRMVGVGRIALFIIVAVFVYLAYHARGV
jgi:hypothetical protein